MRTPSTNLNILNKVNEPTFVINNWKEVIQLTQGTDKMGDLMINWHVSGEISLSDNRYKVFQICDLEVTRPKYCNPKQTNSESYQEDLKANLWAAARAIHLVRYVDMLQNMSHHQNCMAKVV